MKPYGIQTSVNLSIAKDGFKNKEHTASCIRIVGFVLIDLDHQFSTWRVSSEPWCTMAVCRWYEAISWMFSFLGLSDLSLEITLAFFMLF